MIDRHLFKMLLLGVSLSVLFMAPAMAQKLQIEDLKVEYLHHPIGLDNIHRGRS